MTDKIQISTKSLLVWLVTFLIPVCVLLIPTGEVFSAQIRLFLAISIFAILTLAFDTIDLMVVAVMLPAMYVITGIANGRVAFAGWGGTIPWLVFGGLLLANVMNSTGILRRIAYKCLILTGGTYKGMLWGICAAGLATSLIIMQSAYIPMAAFAFGLCQALDLGKSKASAGIMLAAAMSTVMAQLCIYNPSFFIMVGLGKNITGPLSYGWLTYLLTNLPTFAFIFLLIVVINKMFAPDAPLSGKAYFEQEYQKLGPMRREEKKALLVALVLLIALTTTKYHGIDPGWCVALIPLLSFLPGISIGSKQDIQMVNYSMVFFVAACLAIGNVADSLGLGGIIGEVVTPYLSGKSASSVLILIWFLTMALNFLLTPLAIQAAFTVPFATIAMNMDINPLAMYMVMSHGGDAVLLPYEYAKYLLFFSFGVMEIRDFCKFMGLRIVLDGIFVLVILLPFWRLIGFV